VRACDDTLIYLGANSIAEDRQCSVPVTESSCGVRHFPFLVPRLPRWTCRGVSGCGLSAGKDGFQRLATKHEAQLGARLTVTPRTLRKMKFVQQHTLMASQRLMWASEALLRRAHQSRWSLASRVRTTLSNAGCSIVTGIRMSRSQVREADLRSEGVMFQTPCLARLARLQDPGCRSSMIARRNQRAKSAVCSG
jgi:hypothetical protein